MALPTAMPILQGMIDLAYPRSVMSGEWAAYNALKAAAMVVELTEAETKRQVNIVAPELLKEEHDGPARDRRKGA